jgi:hypothetical protein
VLTVWIARPYGTKRSRHSRSVRVRERGLARA